jgi:putative endonuclease
MVVYVLRSLKDSRLYIGITEDVGKRLRKHNAGGVPSTKSRRPMELVYQEECLDRLEARRREKFLKSGPGHRFLEERVGVGSRVPI